MESSDTNVQSVHTEKNETSLSMIASMYNSDEEIDVNKNESDKINKTENQSSDKTNKTENQSSDKIDETENQSTASINQTHILQQYRTVILSSNEDTDSEDESSSSSSSESSSSSKSSSDNDSDLDAITKNKEISSKMKSDEVNESNKTRKEKTEFDDLPPIEDLQISVSENLCILFGKIDKIVEQLVVIKPLPLKPTLNLDTVLFLDKGQRALGKIFDVFGSVNEPFYCIRFNNSEHIKQNEIEAGLLVYYCPDTEYTHFVFLSEITKQKACDAVGDDEPPEFSDDEEEQAYYRNLKNQKNNSTDSTTDNNTFHRQQRMSGPSQKSKRGWRSNPWNRSAQWRNSNRFRHTYKNWQQGYAYQNNAYWLANYQENVQTGNIYQYPRVGTSSTFSPHFLNHSQSSNALSSWGTASYPISTQSPMPTQNSKSSAVSSVIPSLLSVPPRRDPPSSSQPPPPGV